jgi:hypothetical protein
LKDCAGLVFCLNGICPQIQDLCAEFANLWHSDILAELHLPRSGIELAIDQMQFPNLRNPNERSELLFLALCSVRRLLNRIHNTIYASDVEPVLKPSSPSFGQINEVALSPGASTINSLESVVAELDHQLESWFYYLPSIIKPELSHNTPVDKPEAWLRLRYWSAKHIISRPCLIYAALATNQEDMPAFVLEYSKICVDSCRNYLETAGHVLLERTVFTWMMNQA